MRTLTPFSFKKIKIIEIVIVLFFVAGLLVFAFGARSEYKLENPNIEIKKISYPQEVYLSLKENNQEELKGKVKITDPYLISDISEDEFLTKYSYLKKGFKDLKISIESDKPLFYKENFYYQPSFSEKAKSLLGMNTLPSWRLIKQLDQKNKNLETRIDVPGFSLQTTYKEEEEKTNEFIQERKKVKQSLVFKNTSDKEINLQVSFTYVISATSVNFGGERYSILPKPYSLLRSSGDSISFSYEEEVFSYHFFDLLEFNPQLWIFRKSNQGILLVKISIPLRAKSSITVDLQHLFLKKKPLQELVSKRTINSKTYYLGNNSFAVTCFTEPIHWQDEAGNWQEVNSSIVSSTDPSYDYMNVTNNFKVYFSANPFGQNNNIKFQIGDAWMTFKTLKKLKIAKQDTQRGEVFVQQFQALELREKWLQEKERKRGKKLHNQENKFQYPRIYEDGDKYINVVYSISSTNLLEEMVLNKYQGFVEISQEIKLHNVYSKIEGKRINFYHKKTNDLLWVVFEPVMYELTNKGNRNYGLHYEVECTNKNLGLRECNNLILTKILDEEGKNWLKDNDRNYPVVIDASAGPNSPSSVVDDSSYGTIAWSNPSYAQASDDQWAQAPNNSSPAATHYLKATDFGFSIPSGATIDGILLQIERHKGNLDVKDARVRLVKGGVVQSAEDKADTVNSWPTSDTYKSYGGSSDLWSNTWSPSDINSSGFGAVLSAGIAGSLLSSPQAFVDHMCITVYYTPSNNPPQVGTIILNEGEDIVLTENSTTTVVATTTVTDEDGYSDIKCVEGKLYRRGVGSGCLSDDNNCYKDPSCATSSCEETSCVAACEYYVWFHADPTDSGEWQDDAWEAYIIAVDFQGASGTNTSDVVELLSLLALDVSPSLFSYGRLAPGDNTGTLNQTTTITNTGNVAIDAYIYGTDLESVGNSIAVDQQEYSTSSGVSYGSGTDATSSSSNLVELDLSKPTSHPSTSTDDVYWGLGVPTPQPAGDYRGTTTFSAVGD